MDQVNEAAKARRRHLVHLRKRKEQGVEPIAGIIVSLHLLRDNMFSKGSLVDKITTKANSMKIALLRFFIRTD